MELSKNYIPASTEDKWYRHWLDKGYFNSFPDERKPFAVVIPPPNVTGVLHMGHTLNETVQDIFVRTARMKGYNACWVPGSDHASIATEAKVVAMLKERGIDKNQLTRAEFLQHAYEWKDKYGSIIYSQIAKLGCSVDWNRTTFTMDDHYYKAVIKVFVEMYNKGLLYRGARMIHWDVAARTALSDEEVDYKDMEGKLYYIKYKVEGEENDFILIATQRPETIMGDVAVCANPADERYQKFHGKKVIVPLINKAVPVIFDDYVDPAFGTGVLKITPAHDINDYNIGIKHNLPVIDTLTEDGRISEAGQVFVGEDRFAARQLAVEQLRSEGLLVKEETYTTRLGYSQRTHAVIEPKISTQWFVRMKELAKPALDAVLSGEITIHPGDKFSATYKYWLENVKDWCISRQLLWGQQIPAWYNDKGNMIVAENEQEAVRLYHEQYASNEVQIKRDEDVLDTWFSSWLWPIEVFKGITEPGNPDIRYYYPTSVLITGQDIIFFWVARMIMAGMAFEHQKPFSDVYFTGIVRDKLGRKMSKQLGNSPDLLELIEKYGADAVRFGIMISSPAGNDLLFDESSLEQGRNFNNKLWNALKLVKMWAEKLPSASVEPGVENNFAVNWFENRLRKVRGDVDYLMSQFRPSEALRTVYSLIWDDFCSWYLEWIKPGFEDSIESSVLQKTIDYFESLLQLLHPFMPFITEEIYHLLKEQKDDLCVKQFKGLTEADDAILQQGMVLQNAITAVRDAKNKNGLKPRGEVDLFIQTKEVDTYKKFALLLQKQVSASKINYTNEPIANAIVVPLSSDKIFIKADVAINMDNLKIEIERDILYQRNFLNSVLKKLSNERFVQNAKPEIVALENKKQSDAEARIRSLEESLANL